MATRLFGIASLAIMAATFQGRAAQPLVTTARSSPAPVAIPWEQLPPSVREVVERPTLVGQGPSETFSCRPEHYFYYLDHPDRAVTAWRRLGAKCVSITDQGNGWFGWADDQGQVSWQTVYSDGEKRVWYAQGKVRPGPVAPAVPVRVVVILHHGGRPSSNGSSLITHHTDMYLVTDSKMAALVTKMLGASAPRMAEQGLGQLQMFFSALCSYLERNPQAVEPIMRAE